MVVGPGICRATILPPGDHSLYRSKGDLESQDRHSNLGPLAGGARDE